MTEQIIVRKSEARRLVRKLPRPANEPLLDGEVGPRWFAVLCVPRMEPEADSDLRRRRYWTFFPHMRKRQKIGRLVTREIITPLFPRYLFVGVRRGQGLFYANEAIGVVEVVRLGCEPLEIPATVMTEIMARCDGEAEDEIAPDKKGKELSFGGEPGDLALLGPRAGAFQGFTRQILRVEGSKVILDWVTGELAVPPDHIAELIPTERKRSNART